MKSVFQPYFAVSFTSFSFYFLICNYINSNRYQTFGFGRLTKLLFLNRVRIPLIGQFSQFVQVPSVSLFHISYYAFKCLLLVLKYYMSVCIITNNFRVYFNMSCVC